MAVLIYLQSVYMLKPKVVNSSLEPFSLFAIYLLYEYTFSSRSLLTDEMPESALYMTIIDDLQKDCQ